MEICPHCGAQIVNRIGICPVCQRTIYLPESMEADAKGTYYWKHDKRFFKLWVFFLLLLPGAICTLLGFLAPYEWGIRTGVRMLLAFGGIFLIIVVLAYGFFALINLGRYRYEYSVNTEQAVRWLSGESVGAGGFIFGVLGFFAMFSSEYDSNLMDHDDLGEQIGRRPKIVSLKELTSVEQFPELGKMILRDRRGKVVLLMNEEEYAFVLEHIRTFGNPGVHL